MRTDEDRVKLPIVAGVVSCLVLAVSGLGLSQARAEVGRHTITGNASSPARGDSKRFFAYRTSTGWAVVVDSWRGRRVRIKTPRGCEPAAIGAGRVVLNCDSKRWNGGEWHRPWIASAKTGKAWRPKGVRPGDRFDRIGSWWVAGSARCEGAPTSDPCSSTVFVNHKTGRRVVFGFASWIEYSLNSSKLRRSVMPKFINRLSGVVTHSSTKVVTDDGRNLLLWTGPRQRRRIGGSLGRDFGGSWGTTWPWEDVVIADGRVTWAKAKRLHMVDTHGCGRQILELGSVASFASPIRSGAVVSFRQPGKRRYRVVVIRA